MIENSKRGRRAWKLFLFIHIIFYEAFFLYTFTGVATLELRGNIFILLLWMPLLLVHTAATYIHDARSKVNEREREAFKQGFVEAMREKADHAYDERRLMLDDEGELVEMPVKRKRYERQ